MTQRTRAEFDAIIAALIEDNTEGAITPEDMRSVITDFTDSVTWYDEDDEGDPAGDVTAALATKAAIAGQAFTGEISFTGTDHKGLRNINLTTTQRDAILTWAAGDTIYNTTSSEPQVYNGATWDVMLDAGGGGGGSLDNLVEDTSPQLGGTLDRNGFQITGLVVGTDVQAYSSTLAAITASFTIADETKLDALPTSAALTSLLALKADLESPTFTGTVTVPNVTAGTSGPLAANTAYVENAVNFFTPASASGPATLALAEDTDNGAHVVSVKAPASVAANCTVTMPGATGTVLSTAEAATLTKGFNATEYNGGTVSSGTYTPDPANGNFQKYVNGGAHTLAVPATTTAITLQVTNNGTAGAITTSAYTLVTGDALTTTSGDDFLIDVRRVNGFTQAHVTVLQ